MREEGESGRRLPDKTDQNPHAVSGLYEGRERGWDAPGEDGRVARGDGLQRCRAGGRSQDGRADLTEGSEQEGGSYESQR